MATAVVVGVWSESAVFVVFVQGASRALAVLAAGLQPRCCADWGGLGTGRAAVGYLQGPGPSGHHCLAMSSVLCNLGNVLCSTRCCWTRGHLCLFVIEVGEHSPLCSCATAEVELVRKHAGNGCVVLLSVSRLSLGTEGILCV